MKLFIGIIFSVLLVQTIAIPYEDPSKPEAMPTEVKPANEVVDQFRRDIMFQFQRFQIFYDLFNERMTAYRVDHVALVREIGALLMEIYEFDLNLVRETKENSDLELANALERLGGTPNACLQDVMNLLERNSGRLGEAWNACSVRTNRTVSTSLAEIFYPIFDEIQELASIVPILTISALSRGNAFSDDAEIIEYLDNQFKAIDLQWKSSASKLFQWETARFDVEGRFYVEEMNDCLRDPAEIYRDSKIVYTARIVDECAPI